MGAMCPCANTCRNTPAPELSLVEILESFLIPIYIYIYWYMASIIKMICCHHDQFLVWLGVARFGYWIQIHTTQPKIKTRLHYPIYVDCNWPHQRNNLLLVGANHPKCFDCPSKIHGQVSLHLILPTNFKNPALGVALVSPMPQKNTFFFGIFSCESPKFRLEFR